MRLVCAPGDYAFKEDGSLNVVLYGQPGIPVGAQSPRGSAGQAAMSAVRRAQLQTPSRVWDLLSIALSVVTADVALMRDTSPDGWTREIDLTVAVIDPDFWQAQAAALETALKPMRFGYWAGRSTMWSMRPLPGAPGRVSSLGAARRDGLHIRPVGQGRRGPREI